MPVVDYEPPTQGMPRNVPQCRRSSSRAPLRRRAPAPALHRAAARQAPTPEVQPGRVRADAPGGDLRRRRAAPRAGSHRPPPPGRPAAAPAGAQPGGFGLSSVGRSATGRIAPVTRAPRCCAGCGCSRRVTATPRPRPRFSAPTAAGSRIHAIACRVEQVPAATEPGGWWWPCTSDDRAAQFGGSAAAGSGPPA